MYWEWMKTFVSRFDQKTSALLLCHHREETFLSVVPENKDGRAHAFITHYPLCWFSDAFHYLSSTHLLAFKFYGGRVKAAGDM